MDISISAEVKRAMVINESVNRINRRIVKDAIRKWDAGVDCPSFRQWVIYCQCEEWERIARDN